MTDLLVKFQNKDSGLGVTRDTLQRMATKLGVSETSVIHLALARLANDTLTAYQADEGPLSSAELDAVQKVAAPLLPKGRFVKKRSLL